ncbi:hypothetical protein CTAYLR_003061 [Chrysophaeum taylorii]|uniref:EF-hand domain-containing protein n=1 Tax=Chrysophaeum taylorii TaxID=2483200 RepID=A0AAD7U6G8_9STRA|nr:hypothetical protein CTAYLR_003061 [Chrysophaeum taylorii]
MGNDVPRGAANRMAIGAMMCVTDIEKPTVSRLRDAFADLAKRSGNPKMLAKDDYNAALATIDLIDSDRDILDRIFVMFDRTGEDRVNYKEFSVSLVPFITATTAAKLEFAFDTYDLEAIGKLKYNDVRFVLTTLNSIASYFGDPVLRAAQIDDIIDDAADAIDPTKSGVFPIPDLTTFVARHRLAIDFIEGKGTARYADQL